MIKQAINFVSFFIIIIATQTSSTLSLFYNTHDDNDTVLFVTSFYIKASSLSEKILLKPFFSIKRYNILSFFHDDSVCTDTEKQLKRRQRRHRDKKRFLCFYETYLSRHSRVLDDYLCVCVCMFACKKGNNDDNDNKKVDIGEGRQAD